MAYLTGHDISTSSKEAIVTGLCGCWAPIGCVSCSFRPQLLFFPNSGPAVSNLLNMQLWSSYPFCLCSAFCLSRALVWRFQSSQQLGKEVKGLAQGHSSTEWLGQDLKEGLSIYNFAFPFQLHCFSITAIALWLTFYLLWHSGRLEWRKYVLWCATINGWTIHHPEGNWVGAEYVIFRRASWDIQINLHCLF